MLFHHNFSMNFVEWCEIKRRAKFDQLMFDLAALGFNVDGLKNAFRAKTILIGFVAFNPSPKVHLRIDVEFKDHRMVELATRFRSRSYSCPPHAKHQSRK